jgi:hypothetical protein
MNLPPPHCGPVEMEVVGTAAFEIRDMKRKRRREERRWEVNRKEKF